MSNTSIAVAYPNLIDAATLSGGSWALPLTKLQTRATSDRARSTNTAEASTVINVDLGAVVNVVGLAIAGHNAGAAAEWAISGSTVASGSADAIDTGPMPCWRLATRHRSLNLIYTLAEPVPVRYLRLAFDDTANPDGYLELGRLFIGGGWMPAHGPGHAGFQPRPIDLSETVELEGGARQYNVRGRRRAHDVTFPYVLRADADEFFDLQLAAGLTGEILWSPFPGDQEQSQRYGFIGTFRELSAIEWPWPRINGTAVRVEQTL